MKINFSNLNPNIKNIYVNKQLDFSEEINNFIKKTGISAKEILYMGDDLPDYEVMQTVGMPTCPKDAVHQIKSIAAYISEQKGGQGCVRDVIEQTLRSQDKWKFQDMKNLANS